MRPRLRHPIKHSWRFPTSWFRPCGNCSHGTIRRESRVRRLAAWCSINQDGDRIDWCLSSPAFGLLEEHERLLEKIDAGTAQFSSGQFTEYDDSFERLFADIEADAQRLRAKKNGL
jgi:hypothetical protein